jgi:hypothetical protein
MTWQLLQYNGAFDAFWTESTVDMRKALQPRLARLASMGNRAGYPVTESMGDGLFELRARCKTVQMRLLFDFLPGQRIVFVWGGVKDQRRLPSETIQRARTLLAEAIAMEERISVAHVH